MHKKTAVVALLAASLLVAGCDDDDEDDDPAVAGPTAIQVGSWSLADAPIVTADPPTITSQPIDSGPPCPAAGPFRAGFNLVIRTGNVSVVLTTVNLRFTDTFGITPQQVTLPMPVPTTQFGTELVQARSTRIFPFDFRFGCGTSRSGTAMVTVTTRDERGRTATNEVRLTVN